MTAVTHAEELWVRIIAVLSRCEQLPEQVEQMTPAELAAWAGRALNDERLLRFVSALDLPLQRPGLFTQTVLLFQAGGEGFDLCL